MRPGRWLAGPAVALSLLLGGGARAERPEQIFERGNSAYEQGRYEEAVEAYRAVLRYKIRDPIVEFNLANAEFRLGNLGQAILHYERARRLDPTDADVRENLVFARSFAFDRVEAPQQAAVVRWVRAVQDRVGPDRQAWVLLGLAWIVAGLVGWCFARPAGWRARHGWSLAALLLVGVVCFASWYATFHRLEGRRLAVVLDDAVEVLAGPGQNNATLFTVHEGLTLEIRAERQEWVQVSLPNGLNGWIDRRALEPV